MLHRVERLLAALDNPALSIGDRFAEIDHLEARHGDIGFMAILLPEHQFVGFGLIEIVLWRERAVAREISNDRIRLGEMASIRQFNDRDLTKRISFKKRRRPSFSAHDVDFNPLIRQTKIVGRELDLLAIARPKVAEDAHLILPTRPRPKTARRHAARRVRPRRADIQPASPCGTSADRIPNSPKSRAPASSRYSGRD